MNPEIARRRKAKAQAMHHSGHEHAGGHDHGGCPAINVGSSERQASLIGGGLLAAYGLTRGSLTGLALAAIGGALAWRGYTGHCQMYEMLGHSTAKEERSQATSHQGGQEHHLASHA